MSIYIEISNQCGSDFERRYRESAPMFRARFESSYKKGYFVESSQFVDSRGNKNPRQYKIKCIADGHIDTVDEYSSKTFAMRWLDNLTVLNDNSVVICEMTTNELENNGFKIVNADLYECWYKNKIARKNGDVFTVYHYRFEADYKKASKLA